MPIQSVSRRRKSISIPAKEFSFFKKWVKRQPSLMDAAEVSEIPMTSLQRLILAKTTSPLNYEKIVKVLNKEGFFRENVR